MSNHCTHPLGSIGWADISHEGAVRGCRTGGQSGRPL
jgi:hypothetical protein